MSDDNGENDNDNSDGDDNHGVAMVITTKMRIILVIVGVVLLRSNVAISGISNKYRVENEQIVSWCYCW